jgi:hypothetical protein
VRFHLFNRFVGRPPIILCRSIGVGVIVFLEMLQDVGSSA